MRKILRVCYSTIIILSMLMLVACNQGSEETKKVALGRYIEKTSNFTLTGAMAWLGQEANGEVHIYEQGEKIKMYKEQEDGSFLEIYNEGLNQFNEKYPAAWISAVTTDDEGNIYLVHIDYVGEEEEFTPVTNIIKINETGMVSIPLQIEGDLPYIIPSQIVVLENGDIVTCENEVQRFSLETGKLIKDYGQIEGRNIVVIGQQFYALNISENQIDVYNLESGQIENHIACSNVVDDSGVLVNGEGKDLYIVSSGGIAHLAEGGSIWEEVVSGNGLSLSMPSRYIEEAIYSNQKFMVRFSTSDYMPMIGEYVYSATTPSKPTEEINIYALMQNQAVQEAVSGYQLTHPEVSVNMQYGIAEGAGISRADAIKALNAEVLSGNGPDLIVLDGLDMAGYSEKGLLADLSEVIDEEMYIPAMARCFKKEDITYGMPLRFTVPTLWGDETIVKEVNSIEKIADYQSTHPEIQVYNDITTDDLFAQWSDIEVESWFNKDGGFDEAKFIDYLKAVKTVAVPKEKEEEIGKGYSKALQVSADDAQIYEDEISGMLGLLIGATANEQRGGGSFKIVEINGEKAFKPNSIISINKNSKKQELAKEILSYMLEEDAQLTDIRAGFPVNREAMKRWIRGENYNKDMCFSIGNELAQLAVSWGYEETLNAFYEEVEGVTKAIVEDDVIIQMVSEAAEAYFEEIVTAEEVASSLKQKLELYIRE